METIEESARTALKNFSKRMINLGFGRSLKHAVEFDGCILQIRQAGNTYVGLICEADGEPFHGVKISQEAKQTFLRIPSPTDEDVIDLIDNALTYQRRFLQDPQWDYVIAVPPGEVESIGADVDPRLVNAALSAQMIIFGYDHLSGITAVIVETTDHLYIGELLQDVPGSKGLEHQIVKATYLSSSDLSELRNSLGSSLDKDGSCTTPEARDRVRTAILAASKKEYPKTKWDEIPADEIQRIRRCAGW